MKTRLGFVSNSSTQSFILAPHKDVSIKDMKFRIDVPVSGLLDEDITTDEQLKHYIVRNQYGASGIAWEIIESDSMYEYLIEEYYRLKKMLDEHGRLVILNISNEDEDEISAMLWYADQDKLVPINFDIVDMEGR